MADKVHLDLECRRHRCLNPFCSVVLRLEKTHQHAEDAESQVKGMARTLLGDLNIPRGGLREGMEKCNDSKDPVWGKLILYNNFQSAHPSQ